MADWETDVNQFVSRWTFYSSSSLVLKLFHSRMPWLCECELVNILGLVTSSTSSLFYLFLCTQSDSVQCSVNLKNPSVDTELNQALLLFAPLFFFSSKLSLWLSALWPDESSKMLSGNLSSVLVCQISDAQWPTPDLFTNPHWHFGVCILKEGKVCAFVTDNQARPLLTGSYVFTCLLAGFCMICY